MLIARLELRSFRNYRDASFEPSPGLTVLTGPNATGKTNAIEAIRLLTVGRSFRNPRWDELVRWGAPVAKIKMMLESPVGDHSIELSIGREGHRIWTRDGVERRRVSDVVGSLSSVVFTPDDLSLAKGPAERRRAAIDDLGEQLSKTYGSIRRDYARVVRQRNLVLKSQPLDKTALSIWNEQFIRLGASLVVHRRSLLARVADEAARVYARIASKEGLSLSYEDKVGGEGDLGTPMTIARAMDLLEGALARRVDDEARRQTTLVGPHRDDIVFLIEGKDARAFASQGQQRSVALAWKWAEVLIIESIAKKRPVLLLDDVMSELDAARRQALTDLVSAEVQTLITATDTSGLDSRLLGSARIIEMAGFER